MLHVQRDDQADRKTSLAVRQIPPFSVSAHEVARIHVFGDLKPYQCLEETCPQADTTYASLRELRKHYANVHTLAEITRAGPASCPLCSEELTSSNIHTRFKHVGRHMEDIAFAVVPRQFEDWTFYSESSADSSHGLQDFAGALPRLPSPTLIRQFG